jgi:hypothetical protein
MPPEQPLSPQITPPFGYREVVPLLKSHRLRLPGPGAAPEFLHRANAVPISFTEFLAAAREYSIVFTTGDGGRTFAAVAVLGIGQGENLFFADGGWARGVYLPAYARRYPFCMAQVTVDRVARQERLICVEKAAVDEGGEAIFDAQGQPTPKWGEIQRLLSEYEADLERGREMCSILADYGLLEPFTLQATLGADKGGGAMQLTGMQRVNESRLENLNAAQLKNLLRKGILGRIYMHLLSLDNFNRLLERKAARAAA